MYRALGNENNSSSSQDSRACRLDNPEDAGQIRWVRKEDTQFDGASVLGENLVL